MNINEAILSDTPLENPKDDRLGFASFAKGLTDVICKVSTEECLVFALYGQWGAGKTTCLNFVLHYINKKPKDERPIIVRFNPWWFSSREDLLKQFFKELLVVLHKNKEFKESMALLAEFVETISEIPEPSGLFKTVGKLSSLLLKRAAVDKEAWQLREKIKKSLLKQNKRFLIIIDDIDRLPADEIRSLFRVIKAVADFSKTTYLLSFDKGIVTKALGDLQEGTSGEAYLEKIVQGPFDLPLPDKISLRKIFQEQLSIILSDTPDNLFDQTYWGNVFWDGIDHFLNTMRNAKRLTNALKVTYPAVKREVNPVDFIAIETLRIFSSDIYYLIRNNPDMFAGYSGRYALPEIEAEGMKAFHNKWLEQIPEGDREVIKKLLMRIFLKLEGIFGNKNYGVSWESTWRKQLRICSHEIFPIYFRFVLPEGEISNFELETIMALAKNSDEFSNKLLELSKQCRPDGSTDVSAFLERMQDYTEKDIPEENIPKILQSLFNIGDELLVPGDEGRGMFSWGNDLRIGRIMVQLLRRYESQEERFKLLKEIFSNGKAVSLIVTEVSAFGQEHGKYGGQSTPESERFISVQHLEELEKIALRKIKESVSKNELLTSPGMAHILHRWRDWEFEESVKEWTKQVTTSDKGLVDFLTGFLSKGHSHTNGDRVEKTKWRLDPKSIESFIDPSEIIEKCKKLIKSPPDWLKDRKKIAVETFIKGFDLRLKGKNLENPWE